MPPLAAPQLPSRRSSELSKNAPSIFTEAEEHPIEVTRRDGESLVLMSKRENDARSELLQIAAQLIAVTLDESGSLAERMADRFPWMLALSPEDRDACATDLINSARASFSLNQPHLAIAAITSWQQTASAIASGLGRITVEWIEDDDDSNVVERP